MVGLSKADLRRTFKTYAVGQTTISVDDAYEMYKDIDDGFTKSLEEFKKDFEQFDSNGDQGLDFEEAWKLYKHYYPDEEY